MSPNGKGEAAAVLNDDANDEEFAIKATVRIENATIFIILRPVEPNHPPEYLIVNRSSSHSLIYKQKGLRGNTWSQIKPGASQNYFWENPLHKQRSLYLQLGRNELLGQDLGNYMRGSTPQETRSSQQALLKIEKSSGCLTVLLGINESISFIPWLRSSCYLLLDGIGAISYIDTFDAILGRLLVRVFIKGPTKVLEISPEVDNVYSAHSYAEAMVCSDAPSLLTFCAHHTQLSLQIEEQITLLKRFRDSSLMSATTTENKIALNIRSIQDIIRSFQKSYEDEDRTHSLLEASSPLQSPPIRAPAAAPSQLEPSSFRPEHSITIPTTNASVFGLAITKRNQILVRVFEARELKTLLMQGPYIYCRVVLKSSDKYLYREFTYRCDETTNVL